MSLLESSLVKVMTSVLMLSCGLYLQSAASAGGWFVLLMSSDSC